MKLQKKLIKNIATEFQLYIAGLVYCFMSVFLPKKKNKYEWIVGTKEIANNIENISNSISP